MRVMELFPSHGDTDVSTVLDRIDSSASTIRPFAPEVFEFLNSTSQKLAKHSRTTPALAPLAFFMRKAALTRLEIQANTALPAGAVFVPQGIVFHIPPTNVDTLFLYTLTLALLAGNKNLVRISRNSGPETFRVLDILFDQLRLFPRVAELVTVVQFGHELDILEAFSAACDARMIWGGDQTISNVRKAGLNTHASDLAFPDRLSLSAISVGSWIAADEVQKQAVVEGLYNDVYWFDQMACSSPQSLILVGGSPIESEMAKKDLEHRISVVAQGRYDLPEGQAINKMVAAVNAVAAGGESIDWESNFSVVIDGMPLGSLEDIRPGGGFLGAVHLGTLVELLPWISRKTQTLSTFGFTRDELTNFALLANGKGVDRIVPIGTALDFSDVWDGKNLLLEMMRLVTIETIL